MSSHSSSQPISPSSPVPTGDPSDDPGPSATSDPSSATEDAIESRSPTSDETVISAEDESELSRVQPIPPPTEAMQYRAIGLIKGRYIPSEDQFGRGMVLTEDGTELDAVLLGRVKHLVRKRLSPEQEHLWVVYPRTREEQNQLHIQIMGVWAPEQMGQPFASQPTPETVPNYFSIRGEVVYQSQEEGFVIVKIRQTQKPTDEKKRSFKLRLEGQLPQKGVGKFWELEVFRKGSHLQIESSNAIGSVAQPRPRRKPMPRSAPDSVRGRPQRPRGAADVRPMERPQARSSRLPKPILKKKQ